MVGAIIMLKTMKEVLFVANRIKSITIEIDVDTTKLQTTLKSVKSIIKNAHSQLKNVDKLLSWIWQY